MSNALNVKNLEIEEQKTQEYFLINRGLGTVTETPINIEVVKDSTNQLVAMADGKSIGNVDTFDYTQIILSELSSLFEVQSNPVYRIKSSDGNEYILKAPFMSKDEVSISLAKVIKKMYQKIKQGELNDQVLINTVTSLTNSSFANPNRNEHEIKNIIDISLYAISKSFANMTINDLKRCREKYLQMILFDYITGQTKRTFDTYSVAVSKSDKHVSFGDINSFDRNIAQGQDRTKYVLNMSVVDKDSLINTIYKNYYSSIKDFSHMLKNYISDYKKSVELIVKNNSADENYQQFLNEIYSNLDKICALDTQYHVEGNKIESTQTNIGIQLRAKSINNQFVNKYPEVEITSPQLEVESSEPIEEDEDVKLLVEPAKAANGFINKLLIILFVAFICGVGVGIGFVLFRLSGI